MKKISSFEGMRYFRGETERAAVHKAIAMVSKQLDLDLYDDRDRIYDEMSQKLVVEPQCEERPAGWYASGNGRWGQGKTGMYAYRLEIIHTELLPNHGKRNKSLDILRFLAQKLKCRNIWIKKKI